MKFIFIKILLISSLLLMLCNKNKDSITSPEIGYVYDNLLLNSSFEINDSPSYKFWHANEPNYVNFSEETPPEGGQWSIELHTEWGPPKSLSQGIKTITGNNIYKFSFWAKPEGDWGRGLLLLENSDTLISSKYVNITDTNWFKYIIADTVSSTQWDTIHVMVNGGISQFYGKTKFDLCSLSCRIYK